MNLTDEQRSICDTCKPPAASNSQLVRVTAAAGAGKTAVLLALAQKAVNLGHRDITYLTFSKAAAKDGKQRLINEMKHDGHGVETTITAATIHSTAQRVLKQYYERLLNDNSNDKSEDHDVARKFISNKILNDRQIQEWIAKELDEEIEEFLKECYLKIEETTTSSKNENLIIKIRRRKQRARRKVEEFIWKTLIKQFCNLKVSVKQFSDKEHKQRVYFMATKFHVPDKNKKNKGECQGTKYGFDHSKYKSKDSAGNWYADMAIYLWRLSLRQGIRCFAFEVKRAQLLKLQLPNPSTLLLLDESQDMDECQVDWMLTQQSKHKLQLYVVGDAAQCIYGFRGARSRYLMDLPATTDKQLTASWRFGPQIAAIANVILFAKEKSIQSRPKFQYKEGQAGEWKYKYWIPYRVTVGDTTKSCRVLSKSILSEWKTQGKITILGISNACLFSRIVDTFLADVSEEDLKIGIEAAEGGYDSIRLEKDGDDSISNEGSHADEPEEEEEQEHLSQHSTLETKTEGLSNRFPYPKSLPKFHVNSGSASGRSTFKKAFRQIRVLFDLFMDQDFSHTLPKKDFPEFEGAVVAWKSFLEECEEFEYQQYRIATGIISKFGEGTLIAVKKFETYVLGYQFTASQADIILSTAHSAKGMQWDQVELIGGFPTLASFNKQGAKYDKIGTHKFKRSKGDFWQFAASEFSVHLNLLYVAATRARRTLVINTAIADLLNDFDALYQWILKNELRDDEVPESKTPPKLKGAPDLDLRDIPDLFRDLVLPFRLEHSLDEGTLSLDTLLQRSCSSECLNNDPTVAKSSAAAERASIIVTPDTTQDIGEERGSGTSGKRRRLFDAISNIPKKRRSGSKSTVNENVNCQKSSPQKKIDSFLRLEKTGGKEDENFSAEVESVLETNRGAREHKSADSSFKKSKGVADSSGRKAFPRKRNESSSQDSANYGSSLDKSRRKALPRKRNESISSQDFVKCGSSLDENMKAVHQTTMDSFFSQTVSPKRMSGMSHDVSAADVTKPDRKHEGRKRKRKSNNAPPRNQKSVTNEAGRSSIKAYFSGGYSNWECTKCTLKNPTVCKKCHACGGPRSLSTETFGG